MKDLKKITKLRSFKNNSECSRGAIVEHIKIPSPAEGSRHYLGFNPYLFQCLSNI